MAKGTVMLCLVPTKTSDSATTPLRSPNTTPANRSLMSPYERLNSTIRGTPTSSNQNTEVHAGDPGHKQRNPQPPSDRTERNTSGADPGRP
jgi:hypothetical protein